MFIPYDYTEAELKYVGGGRDTLEQIEDFWDSIGNPMYNKRLSFEDNMLNVYNSLRYWPKPMLNDSERAKPWCFQTYRILSTTQEQELAAARLEPLANPSCMRLRKFRKQPRQ